MPLFFQVLVFDADIC